MFASTANLLNLYFLRHWLISVGRERIPQNACSSLFKKKGATYTRTCVSYPCEFIFRTCVPEQDPDV